MKKYYIKFIVIIALSFFTIGCKKDGEDHGETEPQTSEIVGPWQWREIDNGVTFKVDFIEDGRLSQYFEDHTGYAKQRFGNWQKQQDTLIIEERQGAYKFLIVELTDSLMLLVREDSTTMLFDRIDYADLP